MSVRRGLPRLLLALAACGGAAPAPAPALTANAPAPVAPDRGAPGCPPTMVDTPAGQTPELLSQLLGGVVGSTSIGVVIDFAVDTAPPPLLLVSTAIGAPPAPREQAAAWLAKLPPHTDATDDDPLPLRVRWTADGVAHMVDAYVSGADPDQVTASHDCVLRQVDSLTFIEATAAHPALDPGWLPAALVEPLRDRRIVSVVVADRGPDRELTSTFEADRAWIDGLAAALTAAGLRDEVDFGRHTLTGPLEGGQLRVVVEPGGAEGLVDLTVVVEPT